MIRYLRVNTLMMISLLTFPDMNDIRVLDGKIPLVLRIQTHYTQRCAAAQPSSLSVSMHTMRSRAAAVAGALTRGLFALDVHVGLCVETVTNLVVQSYIHTQAHRCCCHAFGAQDAHVGRHLLRTSSWGLCRHDHAALPTQSSVSNTAG